MKVVYHANYAVWFEVARTNALRETGHSYKEMEQLGVVMPVVELNCKYKRPATYDDILEVHAQIITFTGVKLVFRYKVIHKERQELLAEGETVHAFLKHGRPINLKKQHPEFAELITNVMEGSNV
ncbi:hypothetical protein BHF68_12065 [Desulfuribacillus alkaliarsenatis]|uniref:Thioesterase domain-containing protein n=2 Tax=Desulfuribacillus alkaliarsenatis TaxID=766136 RepID=A0A1E5FYL7_9FIRM|nr:hypothetical protein BHF68_12065 [Desulfuribacillus alkaliarsenatis]